MADLWKVDLHCHTWYSRDSLMNPRAVVDRALALGLDKVAITEHNNLAGARFLKQYAPDLIIVGEEIKTTAGEFIAYFVTEEVPKGLTPEETLARLRAQGAVISIPHPLDSWRRSALGEAATRQYIDQVDALEVFNARCLVSDDNDSAKALAKQYGKLITAGSDAHTVDEIGHGYLLMPPFADNAASFRASLAQAQPVGRPSGLWVHFRSSWAKVRNTKPRS
jgi:hypothetical protein